MFFFFGGNALIRSQHPLIKSLFCVFFCFFCGNAVMRPHHPPLHAADMGLCPVMKCWWRTECVLDRMCSL